MKAHLILTATLMAAAAVAPAQTPVLDANATLRVVLDHADGVYRDGDYLRVQLQTSGPMHLYVLYHQASGDAVMVFPNTGRRDSRLNQAGDHELPARDDEVQCVVRGPFEAEAVQVIATATPIAAFEAALNDAPDAVPVMTTTVVDAVCAAHAGSEGLASQVLPVTCPAAE